MSNEARKDFNAMLNARRDMPKIQIITDPKAIAAYGGDRMYFARPSITTARCGECPSGSS